MNEYSYEWEKLDMIKFFNDSEKVNFYKWFYQNIIENGKLPMINDDVKEMLSIVDIIINNKEIWIETDDITFFKLKTLYKSISDKLNDNKKWVSFLYLYMKYFIKTETSSVYLIIFLLILLFTLSLLWMFILWTLIVLLLWYIFIVIINKIKDNIKK